MLKGDDRVTQSKNKFQKRPALKRTCPLELIEEEECNSNKSSSDRSLKSDNSLEQENQCLNGGS